MRYLGHSAQAIRRKLDFKQSEMAEKLGITVVHLSNIENDKAMPSSALIGRYRELSGVDIYVLDWCSDCEVAELPKSLQSAAAKLREFWLKDLA